MTVRKNELGKARVVGKDIIGLLFAAGVDHIHDQIQQEKEMMERRDALLRRKHGLPPRDEDFLYL